MLLKGWWWCSFERKKSEAFGLVPNMRQEKKKAKEYERTRALERAVVEVVLL